MDTSTLVKRQIKDGRILIKLLVEQGIDVTAACWLKTSEEGIWFLYIATEEVERSGLSEAYRKVYQVLRTIQGTCISSSEIKLIGRANPITGDVLRIRGTRVPGIPTRYHGPRIGNISADEVYVYPQRSTESEGRGSQRHGARVYLLRDGVALVKQTVKRGNGSNAPYVIDEHRERHVDPGDDAALGAAVRAALEGLL